MKQERCPTCKRLVKRTNAMNRRYWLLLHVIADKLRPQGQTYSAESFHWYFKQKFLGCEEIKLPNGKVIQQPNSTAELDKDEFADYALKVELFANDHDCYLEDEAMSA